MPMTLTVIYTCCGACFAVSTQPMPGRGSRRLGSLPFESWTKMKNLSSYDDHPGIRMPNHYVSVLQMTTMLMMTIAVIKMLRI